MIDHDAHQTVTANDQGSSPEIIDHGSPEPASATVGADDHDDHDDRRGIVAGSSDDACQKRGGSGALLGTNISDTTENLGKSSPRRSPERGCYGELLRLSAGTGVTTAINAKKVFSSFEFSSDGSPQAADRNPVRFDRC